MSDARTPGSPPPGTPAARHGEIFRATGTQGSEGSRAFVRERLALFGQVAFWLDLAFFVLADAASVATGALTPAALLRIPGNLFHLVTVLIFGLTWGICRLFSLPRWALHALDATVTVMSVFALCLGSMAHPDGVSVLPAALFLTNVVLARAVLVPSTVMRTLCVSLLAGLPVILIGMAQADVMPQPMAVPGDWPELQATLVAMWVVLACALATVASRVIFGLRREVSEARRFGQYALEEKISEGGMGEVWRARHALLRRPTAIKLLRADQAGGMGDLRFEREVRLTARLTHPNTIAIYDYGRTSEGIFYYAMELLEGVNLHELVRRDGPLPAGRAIHVLRQICGSLAEAHQHGLIHRDVKPANVILCERGAMHDVAKVVDFGLVKDVAAEADTSLSRTDTIAGTPRHMAPEAISSPGSVGPSVDLYGIGTVAYFLATGEHVFEGENFLHLCAQHLSSPPDPPSSRALNTAPPDLERVIMRCLEKHPSRRWASARELDAALGECRDAGAWTQEDARRWWTDRWPLLRAEQGPPEPSTWISSREGCPTLSVHRMDRP